jgi:hypothetical protein
LTEKQITAGKDTAGQDGGDLEQGRHPRLQANTRADAEHPDAGQRKGIRGA